MDLYKLFKEVLEADYIHDENETASYYTKRDGSLLYIYFQWSNGKIDWKNNLDFPAKPYRDMKNRWYAHRGFLRVWKVIEPHIEASIRDESVKGIIIGGYSHGAAIALLCHEYCMFNRPDLAKKRLIFGVGFGCPRVVWGFLKEPVKKRFEYFYVVRNGCDLVTHVPPKLFGFRHVGSMLKIGQLEGYKPIESHYPENYLIELEE